MKKRFLVTEQEKKQILNLYKIKIEKKIELLTETKTWKCGESSICRNGGGTATSSDGDTYIGQFGDEMYKKDGHGQMIWKDGSNYMGFFKSNNMEGQGTYISTKKVEFTGTWKDNKLNGCNLDKLDKLDFQTQATSEYCSSDQESPTDTNNSSVNTSNCSQPKKAQYSFNEDKIYHYAKEGNCWWALNTQNNKWFNLTKLAEKNPNYLTTIKNLEQKNVAGTYANTFNLS